MLGRLFSSVFRSRTRIGAQAALARARTCVLAEQFALAAPLYREAIRHGDGQPLLWLEVAGVLRKNGEKIEAARLCARAYLQQPSLAEAVSTLLEYFDDLRAEDVPEGTADEDFIALLARANSALEAEDLKAARQFTELGLKLQPGWPHLMQRLACLEAIEGRPERANAAFAASGKLGIPPDAYIRLGAGFLAGLDKPAAIVAPPSRRYADAEVVLFAACDAVYFRRFAGTLIESLRRHAQVDFVLHLHVFNPDVWINEEIARLPIGANCVGVDTSFESRHFDDPYHAKTWYSCARFCLIPALLARHELPVMLLDMDILVLNSLKPVLKYGSGHDLALLRWSETRWQIWDHFSASTVLFQPSPGGVRFASMVANYVRAILDRIAGAWYLDQIALFAAHTWLAARGVRVAYLPPSIYALYKPNQAIVSGDAVFWSMTANIVGHANAVEDPLFTRYLPSTRRAFGWSLPGSDRFFIDILGRAPEELGRRRWDLALMQQCESYMKGSRRRAVDAGAHVGFWSEWLARRFEHVAAFEPHPIMQACFSDNVTHRNTTLHRCALGEGESTVALNYDSSNSGMSHISLETSGDTAMRTLDSFGFDDLDFIKIDVEGFEARLLRGAADTLRRNRPLLLIENIERYQTERYAEQPGEVERLLNAMGARLLLSLSEDTQLYAWPD